MARLEDAPPAVAGLAAGANAAAEDMPASKRALLPRESLMVDCSSYAIMGMDHGRRRRLSSARHRQARQQKAHEPIFVFSDDRPGRHRRKRITTMRIGGWPAEPTPCGKREKWTNYHALLTIIRSSISEFLRIISCPLIGSGSQEEANELQTFHQRQDFRWQGVIT